MLCSSQAIQTICAWCPSQARWNFTALNFQETSIFILLASIHVPWVLCALVRKNSNRLECLSIFLDKSSTFQTTISHDRYNSTRHYHSNSTSTSSRCLLFEWSIMWSTTILAIHRRVASVRGTSTSTTSGRWLSRETTVNLRARRPISLTDYAKRSLKSPTWCLTRKVRLLDRTSRCCERFLRSAAWIR